MRLCRLCSKPIPCKIKVDGKLRNVQNRRYCLTCSPYRAHNTRQLTEPLTEEARQKRTAEVRRAKYRKYQRKTRHHRKRLPVALLRGGCGSCGYKTGCPSPYRVHHPDPSPPKIA